MAAELALPLQEELCPTAALSMQTSVLTHDASSNLHSKPERQAVLVR